MRRIDRLAKLGATGAPPELARKLGVSEKTVYAIVGDMREVLGAPIEYCRHRQSYVYTRPGTLDFGFLRGDG
jgi:hypothetical protein